MSCPALSDGRQRCRFCGGFHPLTAEARTQLDAMPHAVLSLLTDAAQALSEAHELAVASGLDLPEQIIQRAAVFTASAIESCTQPLLQASAIQSLAGVMQPPVKQRDRGQVSP